MEVRRSAAFSLGHMQVRPDAVVWDGLLAPAADEPTQPDAEVLAGLVYSAGIAGHRDVLARVCEPWFPASVRTAVSWWQGLRYGVLQSARV